MACVHARYSRRHLHDHSRQCPCPTDSSYRAHPEPSTTTPPWTAIFYSENQMLPDQIGCLGRHLVEVLKPWESRGGAVAIDSTALQAKGGVWHKKDRERHSGSYFHRHRGSLDKERLARVSLWVEAAPGHHRGRDVDPALSQAPPLSPGPMPGVFLCRISKVYKPLYTRIDNTPRRAIPRSGTTPRLDRGYARSSPCAGSAG
jgi:hypothetical protein